MAFLSTVIYMLEYISKPIRLIIFLLIVISLAILRNNYPEYVNNISYILVGVAINHMYSVYFRIKSYQQLTTMLKDLSKKNNIIMIDSSSSSTDIEKKLKGMRYEGNEDKE